MTELLRHLPADEPLGVVESCHRFFARSRISEYGNPHMSHLQIRAHFDTHHRAECNTWVFDFGLDEVADDLLNLASHLFGAFAHGYAVRSTRSLR